MYTFDRVAIKAEAKNLLAGNRGLFIGGTLVIVLIELLLAGLSVGFLILLLSGVLEVAAAAFFLAGWRGQPMTVGDMLSTAFDADFPRKLGGMLWMELKVLLWSLLLVIPGIVKSYAYFLTPYILRDCPNVSAMDASRLSERMMQGHKTELFLTMLSFLGWTLLSGLTCGVLYVLYVGPYMQLTYAGIYDELKRLALESGAVTAAELDGQPVL